MSPLSPSALPLHTRSQIDPSRRLVNHCFFALVLELCPLEDLPKILTGTDNQFWAFITLLVELLEFVQFVNTTASMTTTEVATAATAGVFTLLTLAEVNER